jgi:small subunit ribosomal protein S2
LASELVRQLVDSGIHFGHRVSRWNPKMSPYIYGKRNGIHIVDIRETVRGLLRAKKFIAQVVAKGDDVLFVGTKRQAKLLIQQTALKVGMPYVSERWLGGTLTNFRTIRSRLARLDELEKEQEDGTLLEYSKKMIASRTREHRKIKRNLEGIRTMERAPKALIIVDVAREYNAIREARKLKIPTVCLIDTDSDPDQADIPIPGNDDAIRAIDVILSHLADAIEQGKKARATARKDSDGDDRSKRRPDRASTAHTDGTGGAPVAQSSATAVADPAPAVAAPKAPTTPDETPA